MAHYRQADKIVGHLLVHENGAQLPLVEYIDLIKYEPEVETDQDTFNRIYCVVMCANSLKKYGFYLSVQQADELVNGEEGVVAIAHTDVRTIRDTTTKHNPHVAFIGIPQDPNDLGEIEFAYEPVEH